jgi:hypothetical protein
MKIFSVMTKIVRAQQAQTGQRPEMADYRKAAEHLARADVAGQLTDKTSDQISKAYLAWLATQEWER